MFKCCLFQKKIHELIESKYPKHVEFVMRDPLLFGDYATVMEGVGFYEDIQDFEASKALFQEVSINTVYLSKLNCSLSYTGIHRLVSSFWLLQQQFFSLCTLQSLSDVCPIQ